MGHDPPEVELLQDGGIGDAHGSAVSVGTGGDRLVPAVLAAIVVGLIGWLLLLGSDADSALEPEPDGGSVPSTPTVDRPDVPRPLLAAELFAADPSAAGLRQLYDVVGGFEGLELGSIEGAFDLVSFDPVDRDRLLASNRLSYGPAENQQTTELWHFTGGVIERTLWAPSVSHDFVHFNPDGTTTMWVHGGGQGFAPRAATVLDRQLTPVTTTEPLYASRFSSTGGTVFALTGNGDYYTNDPGYVELVADRGSGPIVLDDGFRYGWIDNPSPDLLIAYPAVAEGRTSVWDATTLEPMPDHELAHRHHRRVAISGDGRVAVGAAADGSLEVIDLSTGASVERFGSVDTDGVARPITLNDDGTVAITVEGSGTVSLWWVGDDRPVASIDADAGQPRWLSEEYAAASTSVVAADGSRIVIRAGARPDSPTTWLMVDAEIDSWIERACRLAGRRLSDSEADALDLTPPFACR